MLYPRDFRNFKWLRHKTYWDDRHLMKLCFKGFILSIVTSGLHQKGSNKANCLEVKIFSLNILFSLMNSFVSEVNVLIISLKRLPSLLFVHSSPETKNPFLKEISKLTKTEQPNIEKKQNNIWRKIFILCLIRQNFRSSQEVL